MADEPKRKRPKISRGDDDYMPGNITKIELCNFMTFNKLTCKPGSRLNLVIGPNGSGKSSLVCAIALGLGGEPQLLGRATSVGAYVKRGEESGYIKICLRGDNKEEQITITRKIDTRNKSEWLFNGKVVAKKEINEVIQRFNIQVNNLTQFLPQDRVCEFAKLTPVQLLEETEKAVGDPQLPVQHRALIMKSQELKKFERAVESNKGSLDQLKALNAELERDVERVRQREDLLAQAELMKKKLPWLKYDMKKADYVEARKQEKDAKLKLDEAAKALNELREPIEKQKGEKAKQEAKLKKMNGLLDSNMKNRMQLLENYNHFGVLIQGKYNEMEDLRRQEESRQQRISKAKQDLAAAEAELANLPPYEPPTHKMEQLSAQIMKLEETAKEMRSEKWDKEKHLKHHKVILGQCTDRLREMENTNNKRLQALKNSGAEKIFEAYRWVQKHSSEFNKEVYGPVLLEVNVANRLHADYLEGQVAYYVWKAFITQDDDDRDFLVKNLSSFNVPVIKNSMDESRRREPFQITDEMRKLGISSRLDQVFEAPPVVKDVLISQFSLDHSYIGSKETNEKADLLFRLGIMDAWTPENHYRWIRSRYGNHVSGNVDSVDRSRLLLCNLDVKEFESVKARQLELEETISSLDADLKALQTALREKEDEAAGLRRERVNQRRTKLQSIEREDDPDAAIAKLTEQVNRLKSQRLQCAIEIKNLLIEAVAYRRSFADNNMSSIELEAKIKEMESNAKQQEKLAMQASLYFEHRKNEVENCRQQLLVAKKHAESVAMITPDLERAFLEMPTTVEDLEAAIQDTISQANSILFLNDNILEEYEARQRKIEALTEKQEMDEKELKHRLDEINALKESWLPTLRNLVTRINETFSHNFREMAVAGEVSLDEHDTDFDQYGILIKVKFRQTGQLQVLSAHHQSGGERSVSTILYLVSLQDLTNCPFRVVDEINQGMDPINERKMFQQLVRAASQPNTPQCFLLTPKLLPNLEYSDACSILTVMNGPWIEQPSKVWSGGENWGSVRIPMAENRC
ncbi:Structural maintenance of chromosome protein SMC5/Spr18, SMC superfamily [Handroanthus impetiginosus]|uniref:Structural maintenance of chromosomes protein 5 n=1 Tax=Handroanthus impetiginosus TaxID=429701 RepID=A0A2G9I1L3_9LAMI|nr:Structural maintenance of chromosome protein SMC5/Spr18, SMC superfamily [Handroanthus impetiginosus]